MRRKNNYCLTLIFFCIKYKGNIQLFEVELASWVPDLLPWLWLIPQWHWRRLQGCSSRLSLELTQMELPGKHPGQQERWLLCEVWPDGWAAQPGGRAEEGVEGSKISGALRRRLTGGDSHYHRWSTGTRCHSTRRKGSPLTLSFPPSNGMGRGINEEKKIESLVEIRTV